MKKTSFITLICVIIASSCSENVEIQKVSDVKSITDQMLATESFLNLDVDVATLDLNAAAYATAEKKSVVIPVKGNEEKEGILGMIKDGNLIHVSYFKMATDLQPSEIQQSLTEGNFTGIFTIRGNGGQIDLQIEKGQLKGQKFYESARTTVATCGYITTSSGAYGCAGARIENMNWLDKTLCYAGFGACFAQTVISCWIDGCTV